MQKIAICLIASIIILMLVQSQIKNEKIANSIVSIIMFLLYICIPICLILLYAIQ